MNKYVGKTYNRLTIIEKIKGKSKATCQCVCGTIKDIDLRAVVTGNTKSCGCLLRSSLDNPSYRHGDSIKGSKYYRLNSIWIGMNRRCRPSKKNPNSYLQQTYYLKGIRVCQEWQDYLNFKNWALNESNFDPDDLELTLERIDPTGNYCPENCIWIKKAEQSKNRTTNNYITFNNRTMTLTDWAKEVGIPRTTLGTRLDRGWSIERALTSPKLVNQFK